MLRYLPALGRAAISLAIVVAAVAAVGMMGRSGRPKVERPAARAMVEVISAKQHDGQFDFHVDGVVVPFREVDMAAEVAGRVVYKSPLCRAGRFVREGDLLFRIDPTDYELEMERLKHEVEQSVGMLDELKAERESALEQIQLAEEELTIRQRELKRFQTAPDVSVFSQAEIDVAKRNELATRNVVQAAKDQLTLLNARQRRMQGSEQTARTQLRRAELDKQRCEVRARISGAIVTEQVQQEGFVQKAGALLKIRDTSRMEVRCNLRMQQLQWLWESNPLHSAEARPAADSPTSPVAQVQPLAPELSAYTFPRTTADVLYELNGVHYTWRGELVRYADSGMDERTRMVPCIVAVANPNEVRREDNLLASGGAPPALLSGMFVKVRIRARLPRPLVELPASAVGPGGEVWLVSAEETLQRVQGEVVHAGEKQVLLEQTDVLPLGATVITSPLVNPINGYPLEIVAPDPPPGLATGGDAAPKSTPDRDQADDSKADGGAAGNVSLPDGAEAPR